jgi:hypothetical protein
MMCAVDAQRAEMPLSAAFASSSASRTCLYGAFVSLSRRQPPSGCADSTRQRPCAIAFTRKRACGCPVWLLTEQLVYENTSDAVVTTGTGTTSDMCFNFVVSDRRNHA